MHSLTGWALDYKMKTDLYIRELVKTPKCGEIILDWAKN